MPSVIVQWSPSAAVELSRIISSLDSRDIGLGNAAARKILESMLILAKFPNAGRPALDMEPEHRELIISFGGSGYIALYQIIDEIVMILSLRHQFEIGYENDS